MKTVLSRLNIDHSWLIQNQLLRRNHLSTKFMIALTLSSFFQWNVLIYKFTSKKKKDSIRLITCTFLPK